MCPSFTARAHNPTAEVLRRRAKPEIRSRRLQKKIIRLAMISACRARATETLARAGFEQRAKRPVAHSRQTEEQCAAHPMGDHRPRVVRERLWSAGRKEGPEERLKLLDGSRRRNGHSVPLPLSDSRGYGEENEVWNRSTPLRLDHPSSPMRRDKKSGRCDSRQRRRLVGSRWTAEENAGRAEASSPRAKTKAGASRSLPAVDFFGASACPVRSFAHCVAFTLLSFRGWLRQGTHATAKEGTTCVPHQLRDPGIERS